MRSTTELRLPRPLNVLRAGVVLFVSSIAFAGVHAQEQTPSSAPPVGSAAATTPPPPLASPRMISLPGVSPRAELFVKPGHWTAAWVEATAEGDFRGTLESQWVNDANVPLAYPPTGFRLRHIRPAILPKKQLRGLEQLLFTPNDDDHDAPGVNDHRESRLRDSSGRFRLSGQMGLPASLESRQRTTVLRDHQSLFVVLSDRAADYAFLNGFDALAAPHSPNVLAEHDAQYRVVFAAEPNRVLLPASVLGWTTTAFLLWDEFDAARLTESQHRALVDWIYWGGTLIVAGPGLSSAPIGEPLATLLPAKVDGSVALDTGALRPFVTVSGSNPAPSVGGSWIGSRLRANAASDVLLGDAELPLVVEHRVGRGRIVVTAFRPSQSELVAWPSYGSFVNAYLLRRPARYWRPHPMDSKFVSAVWDDRREVYFDDELRIGRIDPWFDPARITGLRFTARGDAAKTARRQALDAQPPIGPGAAAWRDDDVVSETTRSVLRDASGIFVPPASLVLLLLACYVILAVPVNWLIFRTLGRTEWAWLATPVLAFVFTVIVVRAAELDLGFVRSVSDTAIVEIQPGYDRGHVVRNVAIYNSLGTNYRLSGDDASFVALPAAATLDSKQTQSDRTLTIERGEDEAGRARTSLTDFVVDSGSVGLARTEHMTSLGGLIVAEDLGVVDGRRRVRITNGTQWELRDVRLSGEGRAAIDVLLPGAAAEVTLSTATKEDAASQNFGDYHGRLAEINITALWEQLQDAEPNESLRLTAWSPVMVPGLEIDPPPSQRRGKTVVVAHLKYAAAPPPKMDSNTRVEVEKRVAGNP